MNKNIICFDGGGVRGYLTAILCMIIEEKTDKKISDLFDEFYGTSTGSILAVAFASGLYSAKDIVRLYEEERYGIFAKDKSIWAKYRLGKPKYDIKNLQKILDKRFNGLKLSHLEKPVFLGVYDLGKTTTSILSKKGLSQIDRKGRMKTVDFDCFCWEAVSASSSVTTMFDAVKINEKTFVDGGQCQLNNMSDIASLNATKGDLVVSLGTGTHENSLIKSVKKLALNPAKLIGALVSMLLDGGSEKSTMIARYLSEKQGFDFVRIQTDLPKENAEMDNITESNMKALKRFALHRTQDVDFIQLIDKLNTND